MIATTATIPITMPTEPISSDSARPGPGGRLDGAGGAGGVGVVDIARAMVRAVANGYRRRALALCADRHLTGTKPRRPDPYTGARGGIPHHAARPAAPVRQPRPTRRRSDAPSRRPPRPPPRQESEPRGAPVRLGGGDRKAARRQLADRDRVLRRQPRRTGGLCRRAGHPIAEGAALRGDRAGGARHRAGVRVG